MSTFCHNSFSETTSLALSGWLKASNNRWYRLSRDKVDFNRARELCQSAGGNLATVGMRNATVKR